MKINSQKHLHVNLEMISIALGFVIGNKESMTI